MKNWNGKRVEVKEKKREMKRKRKKRIEERLRLSRTDGTRRLIMIDLI